MIVAINHDLRVVFIETHVDFDEAAFDGLKAHFEKQGYHLHIILPPEKPAGDK